jgi:hypothetical protein
MPALYSRAVRAWGCQTVGAYGPLNRLTFPADRLNDLFFMHQRKLRFS